MLSQRCRVESMFCMLDVNYHLFSERKWLSPVKKNTISWGKMTNSREKMTNSGGKCYIYIHHFRGILCGMEFSDVLKYTFHERMNKNEIFLLCYLSNILSDAGFNLLRSVRVENSLKPSNSRLKFVNK